MIRRPPRSTLFPYTRSSDLGGPGRVGRLCCQRHYRETAGTLVSRSEEHTSELQSRPHLVCRLLLEKKNNHRKDSPVSATPTVISSHSPLSRPAAVLCESSHI